MVGKYFGMRKSLRGPQAADWLDPPVIHLQCFGFLNMLLLSAFLILYFFQPLVLLSVQIVDLHFYWVRVKKKEKEWVSVIRLINDSKLFKFAQVDVECVSVTWQIFGCLSVKRQHLILKISRFVTDWLCMNIQRLSIWVLVFGVMTKWPIVCPELTAPRSSKTASVLTWTAWQASIHKRSSHQMMSSFSLREGRTVETARGFITSRCEVLACWANVKATWSLNLDES